MTRPRFDPNPMPLALWIATSASLGLGCILILDAILDWPTSRFTIAVAGGYIAIDSYARLWGKAAK